MTEPLTWLVKATRWVEQRPCKVRQSLCWMMLDDSGKESMFKLDSYQLIRHFRQNDERNDINRNLMVT